MGDIEVAESQIHIVWRLQIEWTVHTDDVLFHNTGTPAESCSGF